MARKIDIEHLNAFTAYLAEKIYALFVKKQFGKGLSENDYTDEEKAKLSGIAEGANRTVTDAALSISSENPIQNKAVKAEADRLQGEINQKVPSSRTVNGHALTGNISLTAADVGADASGSAATALGSAKSYTDKKIVDLIGGAPETLDTLKEVADALAANEDVVEALDAAIGTKASTEALQAHTNSQSNPHKVTQAQVGLSNVENKTGAEIRGEMTKAEVVKALGYTPSAITNVPDVATNDQTPTFTQAAERANITSGEKLSTIFGKIMKWYADLKGVAFSGSYHDLSNRPSIPAAVAVKGNAESSYRTGNVNLTPENLGAAAASHSHTASQVTGLPSSLPANGGTANYANYLNAVNIPANANLNSYTTPGFYYCPANATVATLSNRPTGNAFFMIVGKHAGTFQLVVEYMASGFKAHMRNYYNGTWGAWVRIYTTIDKPSLGDIGAAASGHTHGAATQSTNGLMSAADKKKLDGVADNANNYTHPTTAGNKHIPSGGASGQILRWSAAGTAAWGADNNTTYSAATQSANGLMSAADKKKLDGIVLEEETEANIDKIIAGTYA